MPAVLPPLLALLPPLFALLVFAERASTAEAVPGARRRALLVASVVTGVVVVASAEALSLAGAFARGPLAAVWAGAVAAAGLRWARATRSRSAVARPRAPRRPGEAIAYAGVLGTIAALTGVVALAAPPNTWDATTYHLARVGHWIQDARVGLFPTPNPREIELAPFAELAIAHLALLSGGDRLANLVQWSAMLGSWVAVSRIAAQIGAGPRGQALAAVFAATLPMAILQGSSAQNDHVAAFWLVAFASLAIDLERERRRPGGAPLAVAAAALGLGVLTKGTVAVYAPAVLVALGVARAPRDGLGIVRPALVGLAMVVVLNAGHAARNVAFGNPPLGATGRYRVAEVGPRLLVSSVARNASLHLATPSERWNRGVERAVRALHAGLGLDVDPAATTYRGTRFAIARPGRDESIPWAGDPSYVIRHEDHAGGPLHLLILLALAPLALLHPRLRGDRGLRARVLVGLGAFGLFCLLLRWQPWHARLHLPAFVLCAPWVGRTVASLGGRRGGIVFALVLGVAALPWLLAGRPRPLLGPESVLRVPRATQYLASRPRYAPGYRGAADHLRRSDCRHVGLLASGDSAESPLRALLAAEGARFRVDHVGPGLPTPPAGRRPCAIVSVDPPRAAWTLDGARYTARWISDTVNVLEPDGTR